MLEYENAGRRMDEDDAANGDTDERADQDSTETSVPDLLPTPILGEAQAPVTVAVYEDFACGGCRAFHDNVLPRLQRDYIQSGIVRYEHHDYPRSVEDDLEIRRAANAARAVQDELGDAAFYDYASQLFANQRRLGLDCYAELAAEVDADPDAVRRAARIQLYAATIDRDRDGGDERGVGPVPAIFVEDEAFTGTSLDGLTDLVEQKRP